MTTADVSTYVTDEEKIIKRPKEPMNGRHKTEDMLSLPFRNSKMTVSKLGKNTNIKFL